MKPAPPVIIIFFTSGNGSYFVLPVKTGASFQTPKSSKKLFESELDAGVWTPLDAMLMGRARYQYINESSKYREKAAVYSATEQSMILKVGEKCKIGVIFEDSCRD
jgi:hypothetical protein